MLYALLISLSSLVMQTPPTKVSQPDGTIQLVPVPPATVVSPYYIDPTMEYQLYLTSRWSNKRWNGEVINGLYGYKDNLITVDIVAMPYSKSKIVNGKTVYLWSIYRSSDVIIQYDHTRLELIPADQTIASQGSGFDPNVIDVTKIKYTPISEGMFLFHSEVLKEPQLRIPPSTPKYYLWNFNGYMWQSTYRKLGELRFKVKDDYYLPTWGSQKSFVRILQSNQTLITKIDGSPVVGTNVLKDIRTECEDVIFGVPPMYKISHYLTTPVNTFRSGDIVPVQIKIKADTKPQLVFSVSTNFIWDKDVLELVELDKTGARPSTNSSFAFPGIGSINESSIPKDGNAWHNWIGQLGSKSYISEETLIVTLKFKVLQNFNTTKIEIVKKNDPRLASVIVREESRPLGSSVSGSDILGSQNGIVIKGTIE
jgi:hypothetical protein